MNFKQKTLAILISLALPLASFAQSEVQESSPNTDIRLHFQKCTQELNTDNYAGLKNTLLSKYRINSEAKKDLYLNALVSIQKELNSNYRFSILDDQTKSIDEKIASLHESISAYLCLQ